jgi:hypothetical protein
MLEYNFLITCQFVLTSFLKCKISPVFLLIFEYLSKFRCLRKSYLMAMTEFEENQYREMRDTDSAIR